MSKLLYPNCSELVCDFQIHEPQYFLDIMNKMSKKYGWVFEPKLTLELLKRMIKEDTRSVDTAPITIMVINKSGNHTVIHYGNNGYDQELGFYFDKGCYSEYDIAQYPFFDKAISESSAEIKTYDGGHDDGFWKWHKKYGKKKI